MKVLRFRKSHEMVSRGPGRSENEPETYLLYSILKHSLISGQEYIAESWTGKFVNNVDATK